MSYLHYMKRQEQVRSVDLTFRPSVSEEEFAEMAENAKLRGCAYCGKSFNVALGFDGPTIDGRGNRYCAPRCVTSAERETAVMIRNAPEGTRIEGYDV